MRNLFQNSSPSPHLPRNVFDLSQNQVFSAKVGQLLPIYCDEVNPNESFKISVSSFLRTLPLNTAAYARFTQRVDFFFVPFRLICNRFFTTLFGTQFATTSHSDVTPDSFAKLRITRDLLDKTLSDFAKSPVFDSFGCNTFDNAVKLLDLLGYGSYWYYKYGPITDTVKSDIVASSPDLLPFRLCAYQKIYEDFFRQTDYEASSTKWNLDKVFDATTVASLSQSVFEPLLVMRYANCNRDYFSATHPTFQGSTFLVNPAVFPTTEVGYFGHGGQQEIDEFQPAANTTGVVARTAITDAAQPDLSQYGGNTNSTNMMGFAGSTNIGSTSAAAIRVAFALDKLYRSTIEAADGSYASQVKAHFGFSIKHDPYKSIYIGGCSSPIQINEVITTANTTDGNTGDIYGRGISLGNSSVLNFTSNEHGFIIGIFSVVPSNLYPSIGVDYMNTAFNRTQWYQPEFDQIGYQPIAGFELNGLIPGDSPKNAWFKKLPNVVGFTPRYAQYKTKVDKVHFPFYSFQYNGDQVVTSNTVNGSLTNWSLPRFKGLYDTFSNNAFLSRKVRPSVIDSISPVHDDGTINTDFLLCNLDINCKALRNMSVDGQPNL